MNNFKMDRRRFLQCTAAAGIAAGIGGGAALAEAKKPAWQKAILYNMLPKDLPDKEKFELAKRCGFDGLEVPPLDDLDAAVKQAELARKAGVPIHGLIFGGRSKPLSSPDPAIVQETQEKVRQALRHAQAIGADAVLLVPADVNEKVGYAEAYERSQANLRPLVPVAEQLKVVLAIENVWNKFLLSPIEFARYVDEMKSPWVRAYFDVGNVIIHGFSQDWIRTLGKRIVRVHIKDFKRKTYEWLNLGEGDVNWPEVRRALIEIGYEGWMTVERDGGDQAYLTDLAARMDRLLIQGT